MLFKSIDGGRTWKKILYISSRTGIINMVMDPVDSKVLYAASWDRDRSAWNMTESGVESSIYKTLKSISLESK